LTLTIKPDPYDEGEWPREDESGGRTERVIRAVVDRVRADLVGTAFRVEAGDDLTHLTEGDEPGMATFADLAVALAPVVDPRSGRRVGVVALTCPVEAASELMPAYVRRLRREIEDELANAGSAAERALTAHFVRVRRHARGAIVSVNERTMIANAAAAGFVGDDDRSTLWEWARHAIAHSQTKPQQLRLSGGITATVRCEPIELAGATVGALVRLGTVPPASSTKPRPRHGKKPPRRASFGWESLSASQLGIAELVAGGLTNGEVAARLYLSPHTVDFHLRQIFSKLNIESRVALARIVSERHVDERQAS